MTEVRPEGVAQRPAPLWAKIAAVIGLLTAVLLVGSIAVFGIMYLIAQAQGVHL